MNRIAELRKEKSLTQKELSNVTDIPLPSLSSYERGVRNPKINVWQKLADFFDVPISYLQGTDSYSVKEIKKLLENYKDDELGRDIKQKAFEKAYSDVPVVPDPTIPLLKKLLTNAQNDLLTNRQKELLDLFLPLLLAYDDQKEDWFTLFTENIFNFLTFKDFGSTSQSLKEDLLQDYSKLIDKVIESKKDENS